MNLHQWHKWRKDGIGGSDAAVVLKKFPFGKTPRMLYREKTSSEIYEKGNIAMEHGKDNEERALQWFENIKRCDLFRQVRVENKSIPWIRATLDGIDLEAKYMVEVKCPYNLSNHELVKATRKVPEIYYPQCQHQMLSKDLHGMYFVSFNTTNEDDSVILEVERDEKFLKNALQEYEKFWECVQNKIPPPLTEFDLDARHDDEKWCALEKEWKETNEMIQNFHSKERFLRDQLIALSNENSCIGNYISLSKSECKGGLDYEKIRNDYPDIPWESYRKESFTKWTIRNI